MEFSNGVSSVPDDGQVCVRRFSALEGLQQAHTVTYRLAAASDGWQLDIQPTGDPAMHSVSAKLDVTEKQAHSLLTFLYENAVPPEHGMDVLADLLPPEKWIVLEDCKTYEKKN